jgi:hypothetical protein
MAFLDNYEDVNARIKRFRAEYPTGRLLLTSRILTYSRVRFWLKPRPIVSTRMPCQAP